MSLTRRQFLRLIGAAGTLSATSLSSMPAHARTAFALAGSSRVNALKWRQTPTPDAGPWVRIDDIWFLDPNVGWAVNTNSQILKTSNGGKTWDVQWHKTTEPVAFRCVGFATALRGWVGAFPYRAGRPFFFDTRNGGKTWEAVTNLPKEPPLAVCGLSVVSKDVVYACGTNYPDDPPRMTKTTNGGGSWTALDMGHWASLVVDAYFVSPDRGWVVGGKAQSPKPPVDDPRGNVKPVVLYTDDGGKTWKDRVANLRTKSGEWGWKIQFLNERVGFVSLENRSEGAILKTTDGGQTWERLEVNDAQHNANLQGVGFIDENRGWVGGWGADFKKGSSSETPDGGHKWFEADEIGLHINRFRFFGNPVTIGYASGKAVYKYSDEPVPLSVMSGPATQFLDGTEPIESVHPVRVRVSVPPNAKRLAIDIWERFGKHVHTLVDEPKPRPGRRTFTWNLISDTGKKLRPGIFILRVRVDDRSESRILSVKG